MHVEDRHVACLQGSVTSGHKSDMSHFFCVALLNGFYNALFHILLGKIFGDVWRVLAVL